MSAHTERALVLLQQSRPEMAEKECRLALQVNPNNVLATTYLALALNDQEKTDDARLTARSAVSLGPDIPYTHYVLACILHDQDRIESAEAALREAIRLDPTDADYFDLRARLFARQGQWEDGLRAAEYGLSLDAENVACANTRTLCLVQLGRRTEADETIKAALARDPDNAMSHANRGWTRLESGDHRGATAHFKEALRLEPDMEWARKGLLESLKSRRLIYRLMLKYFLFMGRQTSRTRWMIIIGMVVLVKIVRFMGEADPSSEPIAIAIVLLYGAFVLLTWIAKPMFNLLLRLDPLGRNALSDDERRGANVFGLWVLLAIASLCLAPGIGWAWAGVGALIFVGLILPSAAIFDCPRGPRRVIMMVYTLGIALIGLRAWVLSLYDTAVGRASAELGDSYYTSDFGIYFMGILFSTWIGMAAAHAGREG